MTMAITVLPPHPMAPAIDCPDPEATALGLGKENSASSAAYACPSGNFVGLGAEDSNLY
jgi:hypothetical protein